MSKKIAINGFGRIGRLVFRLITAKKTSDLEIVAINTGSADPDYMAYQLKYDSVYGPFNEDISSDEDHLIVNGKKIPVYHERELEKLPWKDLEIDIVLECTGHFTERDAALGHVRAGAKHVLISAPGKGDMKTVVFGVNEEILDGSEEVFSAASCTTNCLAPMVKVLNDKFGIKLGQMTTIHAYTLSQTLLDFTNKKRNLRRGRAAAVNVIPTTTGAAKAVGKVIPEVDGKITSTALRVPTAAGSLTELVTVLEKQVTVEEINAAMKEASNPSFGYNEDDIVSSDIVGNTAGSIFDATLTSLAEADGKQMVKTVSWYDNEMGYSGNLVRTLEYFASLI